MKKRFVIIAFLPIPLFLCLGFFFYKGGHHAVKIYSVLEDWLDTDSSDQSLHVEVNGFALDTDLFWTEKGDSRIWGLENDMFSAYLQDGILYMDTGNAYTIELPQDISLSMPRFLALMLFGGQAEKDGEHYRLTIETEDLLLNAKVSEDSSGVLRSCELQCISRELNLTASVEKLPDQKHRLPQAVLDAMVQAKIEPPVSLSEPLSVLVPALDNFRDHTYDTTLTIECGILDLTETGKLRISSDEAVLEYEGYALTLQLPEQMVSIDPTAAALAILRGAEYSAEGGVSRFHMTLPADMTAELAARLIPQAADLGIEFELCDAELTIMDGMLTSVTISASGSVPFLLTTIPLTFSAEFHVS